MTRAYQDLSGCVFGKLMVLNQEAGRWRCRCECGAERLVLRTPLENGRAKSCGCGSRLQLAGRRFTRLVAIERLPGSGHARWRCACDCGRETVVHATALMSENTRSCGCLYRTAAGQSTGAARSRTYSSWVSMRNRCCNPRMRDAAQYVLRGIRCCAAWANYLTFLSDMGERPPLTTLDRKDSNDHYSCGKCSECVANGWAANCRWSTAKEQARNRSNNNRLTFDGMTLTSAEWAERYGVNRKRFEKRIRAGWPMDRALSEPARVVRPWR